MEANSAESGAGGAGRKSGTRTGVMQLCSCGHVFAYPKYVNGGAAGTFWNAVL